MTCQTRNATIVVETVDVAGNVSDASAPLNIFIDTQGPQVTNVFITGFGPKHGVVTSVTCHSRGLGNEGPIVTPRTIGPNVREVVLQRGNTFVWKPTVASADGKDSYTWAGDVVVQDGGA